MNPSKAIWRTLSVIGKDRHLQAYLATELVWSRTDTGLSFAMVFYTEGLESARKWISHD